MATQKLRSFSFCLFASGYIPPWPGYLKSAELRGRFLGYQPSGWDGNVSVCALKAACSHVVLGVDHFLKFHLIYFSIQTVICLNSYFARRLHYD